MDTVRHDRNPGNGVPRPPDRPNCNQWPHFTPFMIYHSARPHDHDQLVLRGGGFSDLVTVVEPSWGGKIRVIPGLFDRRLIIFE